MLQQFINRKEELKILVERFEGKKAEFLIIYGRRRVGKTDLIAHSIKNYPNIYFLAEERPDAENIKEVQGLMGDFLKDEEFKMIKFSDWVELFKSFSLKNNQRCIIAIDEFPYLVKQNPAVPSKFQKIWDLYLKDSKIALVLIGSSISMMEKLLGSESPLHGRRTGQLEIKPIPLPEIGKFLPGYLPEDILLSYGCVDGIPLYLKQFNSAKTPFENIENLFVKRDAILYNEAEVLLKQEFRETANYFSILKAISLGNTKQGEIISCTEIEKSIISKYLKNLESVRIIKREYPLTDRKEKRKNVRFAFTDNYFRFWFRFIYPNKSIIEKGESKIVLGLIERDYRSYLGHIFEGVAEDMLWRIKPFMFTKAGRWWHKDKEIDLVSINEETGEIGFFECKWKDLSEKDARTILYELKEKSVFVDWNNETRKEYFGIFAKKIENKSKLRKESFLAFDLEDI